MSKSQSSTKLVFIYALTEPKTGEVRYVGKSDDPLARYKAHILTMRGLATRIAWLHSLLIQGQLPGFVTLEIVRHDCWEEAEQKWIRYYMDAGARLVNATAGGRGATSFPHPDFAAGMMPGSRLAACQAITDKGPMETFVEMLDIIHEVLPGGRDLTSLAPDEDLALERAVKSRLRQRYRPEVRQSVARPDPRVWGALVSDVA